MHAAVETSKPVAPKVDSSRYARAVEASKRIRWDIDRDVIRGRTLDFSRKFMPDGLSLVKRMPFLAPHEVRFMSQVQGRTYANMFRMIERYIAAKTVDLSKAYHFGDQVAFEALVRFTDEELKHQELMRRLEVMMAAGMPDGYVFKPDANKVARVVLASSTWAVLGLTLNIEIVTQAHYRSSIESDANASELWKDVFLFHWKEESQHAILDELEWRREDARLSPAARDAAVDDLIGLVAAVDATVGVQAAADADYFLQQMGRAYSAERAAQVRDGILKAYRWTYIVSGVQEPRFGEVITSLVTPAQMERIGKALAPIAEHVAN